MLFDVCLITNENYHDFINKYGKIQDKDLAIQMLILTPNVWLVLDEEVKKMADVIMYYQPAIIGRTSDKYIAQKGFKLLGDKQIPDINFPDNFDLNTYLEIQNNIPISSSVVCKDKYKKYGNFELREENISDVYIDVYNRNMLSVIMKDKKGLSK